jgi:hypothetical protein
VDEQLAKALHGQLGLRDLTTPVAFPERLVDPAIRAENGERPRQPRCVQRLAQGGFLGTVEVEEGLVGVEENGAKPRQGGGYLAR